ncbi:MAG: hypothetical protein ACYS0E_05675, partial [Planctomycetota bacterium]
MNYASGFAEALLTLVRLTDDERYLDEAIAEAAKRNQRGFIWLAHAHRARLKLPPLPHDTSPEDASFLERLDGC